MTYAAGPVSGASYQEMRTVYVTTTASFGSAMVYDGASPTAGEIWTAKQSGAASPDVEWQFAGVVWNKGSNIAPNRVVQLISGGFAPVAYVDTRYITEAVVANKTRFTLGGPAGHGRGYVVPWNPIANAAPVVVALEAQAAYVTGTMKAYILRR